MLKLYYKIWADGIISANKKNSNWKFLLILIPVFQGVNFATLIILIKKIFGFRGSVFYQFSFFDSKMLNSFLFIIFPFMILNYFLIVVNKKYESLIKNYEGKDGMLVMKYVFISIALFIIPLYIGFFFF